MTRPKRSEAFGEPMSKAWVRWLAPVAVALSIPLWYRQRDAFYRHTDADGPTDAESGSTIQKVILHLAAQDWLLLGYLLTLFWLVLIGYGARRLPALCALSIDIGAFVAILWWVRGEGERVTWLSALLYRFGILVALLGSFLELQWILPAASGRPLDADLHALDLRVFGVEPAEAWDRFVRPATTEWFAFFYYGYFFLVAAHVLPALFFGKNQRFLITFGFGFLWLYCIGHVVYTIVPAYGPYAYLEFHHPLDGGLWWPLVKRTVASVDGVARTDVFPSLHTAGPAFLTLYALLRRGRAPFRYTWLPLAFSATQIILATMFLRWHYLIDVCAGLVLAISGIVVGQLALAWDEARVAAGGQRAWPSLEPAWTRRPPLPR